MQELIKSLKNTNIVLLLLLVTALSPLPVFSQKESDGKVFFDNQQYKEAQTVYGELLKKHPKNTLYNYYYALCSYKLNERETAITHFKLSGNKFPLRYFYLGELYFENYCFRDAIEAYKKYLNSLDEQDERRNEIKKKITRSELSEKLLLRIEDIVIVDSAIVDKNDFLRYYNFSPELGKLQQKRVVFDSLKTEDKIIYTTERGERRIFSDSIGGKMHLFNAYHLLNNWSAPTLLPNTINSNANENYPFLLADGLTMYFSSDGENAIGGYDIFVTRYSTTDNRFFTPENIGMPFNSPYNDYMMVIDESNKIGWFASDRYQEDGKVIIYTFVPNAPLKKISSDDDEYLRLAAQLKTYRKAERKIQKQEQQPTEKKQENKINFLIYDNLIYTSKLQFESKKAQEEFYKLEELEDKLQKITDRLNELRQEYGKENSDSLRSKIAPKILFLEQTERESETQVELLKQNVRHYEIISIEEAKRENSFQNN